LDSIKHLYNNPFLRIKVKHPINATIFVLAIFLVSQLVSAHSHDKDFANIELKVTQLSEQLYMLQGVGGFAGGNLAVSTGEDGLLMVDAQLRPMSSKIRQKLQELGDGKLKYILNTHWHGDHTGGNASFSKETTIIAHENVKKRMSSEQNNYFGKSPASPQQAWPTIMFSQSMNLHFNNEEIKFIHYANGHTDGDGVVYFVNSKIVHMGDLLFNGKFPFVDLNSGGNVFSYIKNIESILTWLPEDVKIIPGHGELTDAKGLQSYLNMLKETSDFVKSQEQAGKSLEEIIAVGLAEKYKSYAAGFIDEKSWITFIYKSL